MDDMKILADFGRELDLEPPAALLRQRNRLLDALETGPAARRSRRRPLLAGATAVLAAGAVLAVTLPTHHGAATSPPAAAGSPTVDAAPAGWSVKTEADGDVQVMFRELTDATAVRQALSSANVPARVWLVPVRVADPRTFGALSTPIVGCTPDYLDEKRIEGATGVDGVEFPTTSAPGVVFTVDPSAMPKNTVVNIILYTLDGAESGYYIAVSKTTDNACTPYRD